MLLGAAGCGADVCWSAAEVWCVHRYYRWVSQACVVLLHSAAHLVAIHVTWHGVADEHHVVRAVAGEGPPALGSATEVSQTQGQDHRQRHQLWLPHGIWLHVCLCTTMMGCRTGSRGSVVSDPPCKIASASCCAVHPCGEHR